MMMTAYPHTQHHIQLVTSYNHGKESFLEANWDRDNNIISQKPQLFQHEGYQTSSTSFKSDGLKFLWNRFSYSNAMCIIPGQTFPWIQWSELRKIIHITYLGISNLSVFFSVCKLQYVINQSDNHNMLSIKMSTIIPIMLHHVTTK